MPAPRPERVRDSWDCCIRDLDADRAQFRHVQQDELAQQFVERPVGIRRQRKRQQAFAYRDERTPRDVEQCAPDRFARNIEPVGDLVAESEAGERTEDRAGQQREVETLTEIEEHIGELHALGCGRQDRIERLLRLGFGVVPGGRDVLVLDAEHVRADLPRMQESVGLRSRDGNLPLLQCAHHTGGQAVPGDHHVVLTDRHVLGRQIGPVRGLREQMTHRGMDEPGLHGRDDHFAVVEIGVARTDVVTQFCRLRDAALHVGAALGVVDGQRLLRDDRAHHPAHESVQDTEIQPALLVEPNGRLEFRRIGPRRKLPGVFHEIAQVARKPFGQRLGILLPGAQQLVDPRYVAALEQRGDDRVGLVVPHLSWIGTAPRTRYRSCWRPPPGPGLRRCHHRERPQCAQETTGFQNVAPARIIHTVAPQRLVDVAMKHSEFLCNIEPYCGSGHNES